VPGLLEDQTKAVGSANAADVKLLRRRVIAHLSHLYSWRWVWEVKNPNATSEIAIQSENAAPCLFETRFQYANHVQVNEIGLYNSIQMWLLQLLLDRGGLKLSDSDTLLSQHLKCSQAWKTKHTSVLLLPGETTSVPQLAVEILRSFECQLECSTSIKTTCSHGLCRWDWFIRSSHMKVPIQHLLRCPLKY
jgi:hypothetical protein